MSLSETTELNHIFRVFRATHEHRDARNPRRSELYKYHGVIVKQFLLEHRTNRETLRAGSFSLGEKRKQAGLVKTNKSKLSRKIITVNSKYKE